MTRWLALIDLEMGVKRWLYNNLNAAHGKPIIWDARNRRYVAHVDGNQTRTQDNPYGPDGMRHRLGSWLRRL